MLLIALPIPIIVNNFQAFYANQRFVVASNKRKTRIQEAKQEEYELRTSEHEQYCKGHFRSRGSLKSDLVLENDEDDPEELFNEESGLLKDHSTQMLYSPKKY